MLLSASLASIHSNPVPIEIDLMQRGLGGVELVEVGDELLQAAMGVILQQMPVEAACFAEFLALAKFLHP